MALAQGVSQLGSLEIKKYQVILDECGFPHRNVRIITLFCRIYTYVNIRLIVIFVMLLYSNQVQYLGIINV